MYNEKILERLNKTYADPGETDLFTKWYKTHGKVTLIETLEQSFADPNLQLSFFNWFIAVTLNPDNKYKYVIYLAKILNQDTDRWLLRISSIAEWDFWAPRTIEREIDLYIDKTIWRYRAIWTYKICENKLIKFKKTIIYYGLQLLKEQGIE